MIELGIDLDGGGSDGYELRWAKEGDLKPLAELIEEGGELGAETRKWLAAYLRGEVKKKRGKKLLRPQIEREDRVARVVRSLRYDGKLYIALSKMSKSDIRRLNRDESAKERFFTETRGTISEYAAINLFVKFFADSPPRETVRTYLRKYKKRYPQSLW